MKSFSHVVPLKTTNAKILKQQIVISFANACVCLLALISVCYPDCSGPREDATRIGSAGVVRRQAVDISPLRRVNQAIYLLTTGARESAFRNIKTIAECLADELINAAKGSSNR
jgi:ribosomal protein uS7